MLFLLENVERNIGTRKVIFNSEAVSEATRERRSLSFGDDSSPYTTYYDDHIEIRSGPCSLGVFNAVSFRRSYPSERGNINIPFRSRYVGYVTFDDLRCRISRRETAICTKATSARRVASRLRIEYWRTDRRPAGDLLRKEPQAQVSHCLLRPRSDLCRIFFFFTRGGALLKLNDL